MRPRPASRLLLALLPCLALAACEAQERISGEPHEPRRRTVDPSTRAVIEGRRHETAGDLDAALASFERAIDINPELTLAYLGAGDIYRKRGDLPAAERRYAKAAEVEPGSFDAQYLHGLTLHMLDRLAEAVRAYLRALAIRPHDLEANLNAATAYLELDEPRQALVYGIRAVRLNSAHGPARANLGAIYAALDDHQAAVTEYQQAAELMDLTPQLLLNMADSLSRIGRHEEAINTLERVLRIEPSAVAYERLGAAAFRQRDYETARESFELALELDPRHYPALNGLAVAHLNAWLWSERTDTQARDEAIRLLRRSLQIEQSQPRILELLRRYG